MTVWAIRCAIAWSFRCFGVALALAASFALIQGYERAPDAFWAVFPLGPAETDGVGVWSLRGLRTARKTALLDQAQWAVATLQRPPEGHTQRDSQH